MKFAIAKISLLLILCKLSFGAKCKPEDFDCGDGICVPFDFVCDGVFDCKTGVDEEECLFKRRLSDSVDDHGVIPLHGLEFGEAQPADNSNQRQSDRSPTLPTLEVDTSTPQPDRETATMTRTLVTTDLPPKPLPESTTTKNPSKNIMTKNKPGRRRPVGRSGSLDGSSSNDYDYLEAYDITDMDDYPMPENDYISKSEVRRLDAGKATVSTTTSSDDDVVLKDINDKGPTNYATKSLSINWVVVVVFLYNVLHHTHPVILR